MEVSRPSNPNHPAPPPAPPPLERYLELQWHDLVAGFRAGTRHFHPSILEVPDHALDTFFRPEAAVGRWSIRALLGHLADAEIVFAHRMRRLYAEEAPVLAAFDEDAFIDAGLYAGPDNPVAGFLAVIANMRNWCGQWLATLPPDAGERTGLHAEFGSTSLRQVLAYAAWHMEHHARFLHLKLAKLDSTPPAP